VRHSLHRGVREAKLFLCLIYGHGRAGRGHRAHPACAVRPDHHRRPGAAGSCCPARPCSPCCSARRAVLGPGEQALLNAVAGVIVAAMLVLSLILVVSTVIPSVDVTVLLVVLGSVAGFLLVVGRLELVQQPRRATTALISREERGTGMPASSCSKGRHGRAAKGRHVRAGRLPRARDRPARGQGGRAGGPALGRHSFRTVNRALQRKPA